MEKVEDVFTTEQRASYEMLSIPLAAYKLAGERIITLLVSDGLCELVGISRKKLMQHFDSNMFGNVHPDDVETLAQIGYRFAKEEGSYDVIYRTKLYGKEEYRYVQTVGKYQNINKKDRVAFLVYTDITGTKNNIWSNLKEVNNPKVDFLNDHMGPMAVIAENDNRLIYYNQAITRIIPPRRIFDSGITFQQFFFPDFINGIEGLLDVVNGGTRVVVEPYTERNIEVSVISSLWNKERVFVVYFYEVESEVPDDADETILRHRRMAFNNIMFAGKQEGFSYSKNGNQNFRVWNLSRNQLFYSQNQMDLLFGEMNNYVYDDYISMLKKLCKENEDIEFLKLCKRERILLLFQSAEYPKTRILNLNTNHGMIYLSLEFIMMQSPDTGEIYIKIWEENVTDKEIIRNLATKAVENEYNFLAYMDVLADRCWVIGGKESGFIEKSPCFKISDSFRSIEFLQSVGAILNRKIINIDELIQFVMENVNENDSYVETRQIPDGSIKTIQIESLDTDWKKFYFRISDVTHVLLKEKEREKELEAIKNEVLKANENLQEAVLKERKKVEAILMQTVLAVSKALDAKDPYTCQHSERVAKYASEIARKLNWSASKVNDIYNISLVHDIGKMGIPDSVLMKASSLTVEEYEMIKNHVLIGSNILKEFTAIQNLYEGILYHHERYDGLGYVFGLEGENIPIEARIIGIADSVDAMYSTRPYREKQKISFIINELIEGKGKQFDPALVEIMMELIEEGLLLL